MVKRRQSKKILTGGDKGKTGKCFEKFSPENKVVEGINISKIHKKKLLQNLVQIIEIAKCRYIFLVAVVK